MPQSIGRVEGNFTKGIPLGARILVRPHETPEYKGRIIIPDSAKTVAPTTGVVLALGKPLMTDPECEIHVGDILVYSKYAGIECKFDDGTRVLAIAEEDAIMIIGSDVQLMEEVK